MKMTDKDRLDKNSRISATKKETMERHSSMICKSYTVKIQYNKLSSKQQEQLQKLFLEAKWLKNYVLNWCNLSEDNKPWKFDTKIKEITHKDKDMNDIPVIIEQLSSQMKQSVIAEMISNIRSVSTLKRKGIQKSGGKLKFVKEVKSINLKQYKVSYNIKSKNKVKIQGISDKIQVNGLEQFMNNDGIEYANAKLLNRPDGYYIQFITYTPKEETKYTKDIVGIDFGCSTSFTLSTGEKVNVSIPESDRLKLLQKKLSRQVKLSKNWYKTKQKIKIEYQHMSNIKEDRTKQFIHQLKQYEHIVIQDEQLSNWHKGLFGKIVQHSILGKVKSILKSMPNVTVISKWEPTTKLCPNCGQIHNISLSQRTYTCDCGYSCERDIHSANNMIWFYKNKYQVPMEHRDFKPVEIKASVDLDNSNNISYISMKQEAPTSLA